MRKSDQIRRERIAEAKGYLILARKGDTEFDWVGSIRTLMAEHGFGPEDIDTSVEELGDLNRSFHFIHAFQCLINARSAEDDENNFHDWAGSARDHLKAGGTPPGDIGTSEAELSRLSAQVHRNRQR
jgi:hypothetical protein